MVLWFSLIAAFVLSGTAGAAPDCAVCGKQTAELAEVNKSITQDTEFLGKNRSYLAVLGAKEASKFIKVSGNIELILNRIDASKERAKALNAEMEKEGCDACPKKP